MKIETISDFFENKRLFTSHHPFIWLNEYCNIIQEEIESTFSSDNMLNVNDSYYELYLEYQANLSTYLKDKHDDIVQIVAKILNKVNYTFIYVNAINMNSYVLFDDDTYAIITSKNYILYDSDNIELKLYNYNRSLINSCIITDINSLNLSKPKINYALELRDLKKTKTVKEFVGKIKNVTFNMYKHPFIVLTDANIGENIIDVIHRNVLDIHDISELYNIAMVFSSSNGCDFNKYLDIFEEYSNESTSFIKYALYINNVYRIITNEYYYVISELNISKYDFMYNLREKYEINKDEFIETI